MDGAGVVTDGKSSQNVIALHLDIRAPSPSSVIFTGSPANLLPKSPNMSRSSHESNRLSFNDVVRSKTRSTSTSRDRDYDVRARFWALLFVNLQNAIDQLFETCEADENISECKEVILVLENYIREFHSLAEWFRMNGEYENTPAPQRPNSFAWEVRKSSPGKISRKNFLQLLIYELDKMNAVDSTGALTSIGENILETNNPAPSSCSVRAKNTTDIGCQTESEKKSCQPIRKPITTLPYTKKVPTKNYTSVATADRNTLLPSSLPSRRLSGRISPRKPLASANSIIPNGSALNIGAAEFVPGQKVNIVSTKPKTALEDKTKVAISRSQSDSIVDVSPPAVNEIAKRKPFASVECVAVGEEKSPPEIAAKTVESDSTVEKANDQTNADKPSSTPPETTLPKIEESKEDQRESAKDTPTVSEAKITTDSSAPAAACAVVETTKSSAVKIENNGGPQSKKILAPSRADHAYKPPARQWDPKPQRPVAGERKTHVAAHVTAPPKKVNQKYVKSVGVPKTNLDARSSPSVPSAAAAPPPVNYSTATKSTKPNRVPASTATTNHRLPIVRSKTSIEMESRSQAEARRSAPPCNFTKTERAEPTRSRRSSKDSDGWETVTSRSRRSIPNSLGDRPRALDINKRFYEPTPSASLPSLAIVDGKHKLADAQKSKNRNRAHGGNANGAASATNGGGGGGGYKMSKERPIITAAFSNGIASRRKKSNEKEVKKTKSVESKQKRKERETASDDGNTTEEDTLRRSKKSPEKDKKTAVNKLQNGDVDADSDGTETDAEIAELCHQKIAGKDMRDVLEAKYSHVLCNMPWADQLETLDKLEELAARDPSGKGLRSAKKFTTLQQFEDLVARMPGRAVEIHQKLSSPSRKRTSSPDSTIMQQKAKQEKAEMNRQQLLQHKSAKNREQINKVAKVKAVKAMQASLAEERLKQSWDEKFKRAEEKRNLHLKTIQEKAHDEAIKLKEIAFIKELEAQNKKHDMDALWQEQEDRMQTIFGERQKQNEEKAAKGAAVKERRKAIEAEKIEGLQEKMRKRHERVDRDLQEKERERIKMAREKARDREDRLLAHQAAQIANVEELQKKIQQKLENSARLYEENIESIRRKATVIGTPRLTPYQTNKLCSLCNVVIDSEVFLLSHLRGQSHQYAVKKYEANVKFNENSVITDAPADVLNEKKSREKERQKTLRKRCKKIRQRLSSRSEKYLKSANEQDQSKKIDSPVQRRILKSIKEIEKLINGQGVGVWANNAVTMLERNLFEIVRVLEKQDPSYQRVFREFDGFAMISKIYNLGLDLPKNMSPYLPLKCFIVASNVYTNACNNNVDNCVHVLLSNEIVQIIDFLLNRLNFIMPNSDGRNGMVVYKADNIADVLMNLCSIIFSNVTPLTMADNERTSYPCADITQHLHDVVNYVVCTGIVDKLAVYCSTVHDNKSADSYFLQHSIELLTRLVESRKGKITEKDDSTQLMETLKATELVGAVSMLYSILLHQVSMSNELPTNEVELQADVVNVIVATLQLFSKVCELNLEFFQNILGAEGTSLQVRHIISYLLKYSIQNDGYTNMLHHVIEFIGFFAIRHRENQMILQSGSTPTVLQQLSNLPFEYFSNPQLKRVLFPTLLACCVDNAENREILDQEVSYQLLEDFEKGDESSDIPLMKLLKN